MFKGIDESNLQGAIEALLFVTDEPVSVVTLSDMLEADPAQVEAALFAMHEASVNDGRGVTVEQVAGGWRMFTKSQYHELLEHYVLSWDTRKLSQAALETLAIVAYGQPITRSAINTIRGVNSDSSLNSLVDKGLVREAGTLDTPGNPMTYATTKTFLEKFGLASTNELPPLEDYAPDDETAAFLRSGLSTRGITMDDPDFEPLEFGGAAGVSAFAAAANAVNGAMGGEGAASSSPTENNAAAATNADGEMTFEEAPTTLGDLMASMMSEALASSAGLVEKINFDELEFEE